MASERLSRLVDGQGMRAYLSPPETTAKVPGVIVLREAFGISSPSERRPIDSPGTATWPWRRYYSTA
jgi:dienelactone hydrolase